MSTKMVRIKVSELRRLARGILNEARTYASRQSMVTSSDDHDGEEQLDEFHDFEDDFADKITDKRYEAMAKEIYDAWSDRSADVDWAGVVNLFARNRSKNLSQEVDKTKLYEKVLSLVEAQPETRFARY